jgi:hypothetical protein
MDEIEEVVEILFFWLQKMKIHFCRISTKKYSKLKIESLVGQKTNIEQMVKA